MNHVQVAYGIDQPETYVAIGWTDRDGTVRWEEPICQQHSFWIYKNDDRQQEIKVNIGQEDLGKVREIQVDFF